MRRNMSRNMKRFYAAMEAGRVVDAVLSAPFGYHSRLVDGLYHFTVISGELNGRSGVAPTFDEAVRLATAKASVENSARARVLNEGEV